jgi:hypothetical protein
MQNRRIASIAFVMALLVVTRSAMASGHEQPPVDAKDLELIVAQVGPGPLPFQPLRVRITLENISQKAIGPIPTPVGFCKYLIKGPHDSDFNTEIFPALLRDKSEKVGDLLREYSDVALGAKERTTGSEALTLRKHNPGGGQAETPDEFVTPASGRYQLKVVYLMGVDKNQQPVELESVLTFDVVVPKGPDKKVAELLAKDATLASAVADSVEPPDPELVPKLLELLKLYPKKKERLQPIFPNQPPMFAEHDDYGPSSYALYAHFALARYYRKGKEYAARPRVSFALAAEQLERVKGHAFAYLPNALVFGAQCGYFDDEIKKLVLDHYADTAEFLDKDQWLFKETPWRESKEAWEKFRKTVPKPFPPPAQPHDGAKPKQSFPPRAQPQGGEKPKQVEP